MDRWTFAIGVLAITAVVMLSALAVMTVVQPVPAQAFAQIDRGDGYMMLTGQLSNSRELLYVLDETAGLLNIYWFDINRRRLLRIQQIPLPQ